MRVKIGHRYHGCECGCCGHVLVVDGIEAEGSFGFDHYLSSGDLSGLYEDHLPKDLRGTVDWSQVEIDKPCHWYEEVTR